MKWLALVAVAAGALRWEQPSGDGVRHGQALAFTPPSHACQPRMHSASSGAGSRWLASGRGRQAGAIRGGARRKVGDSSRNGVCMMAEEIECDVVIVGGGPAGCTCALYTSRADLKVGGSRGRRWSCDVRLLASARANVPLMCHRVTLLLRVSPCHADGSESVLSPETSTTTTTTTDGPPIPPPPLPP